MKRGDLVVKWYGPILSVEINIARNNFRKTTQVGSKYHKIWVVLLWFFRIWWGCGCVMYANISSVGRVFGCCVIHYVGHIAIFIDGWALFQRCNFLHSAWRNSHWGSKFSLWPNMRQIDVNLLNWLCTSANETPNSRRSWTRMKKSSH